MPNPSPTAPGPERPEPDRDAASGALPTALEARIVLLESAADDEDFDAASWFWMLLLDCHFKFLSHQNGVHLYYSDDSMNGINLSLRFLRSNSNGLGKVEKHKFTLEAWPKNLFLSKGIV